MRIESKEKQYIKMHTAEQICGALFRIYDTFPTVGTYVWHTLGTKHCLLQ